MRRTALRLAALLLAVVEAGCVRTVYRQPASDSGGDGDGNRDGGRVADADGAAQPCRVLDPPDVSQQNLSATTPLLMSNVFFHQTTADGSKLLFTALSSAAEDTGIFVAQMDGSGQQQLPLTSYPLGWGEAQPFALSPLGDALLFPARGAAGYEELFVVPLDGTPPTRVSVPTPASRYSTFTDFVFSPDGQHVVCLRDQLVQGRRDLFAARIDGTGWTRLNRISVSGASVYRFEVTAQSDRVVYQLDEETAGLSALYAVKLDGTMRVRLNGALAAGGWVRDWSVCDSTNDVVYRVTEGAAGPTELCAVKSDGTARQKINALADATGEVYAAAIAPDGKRVVFAAKATSASPGELYSGALDGSAPVKLNGTLATGASVDSHFAIDRQSTKVAYLARHSGFTVDQLWVVDIGGGAPRRLNGDLVAGGGISGYSVAFVPDGSRVLYFADQLVDGTLELFSANAATGAWVKLNAPLAAGSQLGTVEAIASDSSRVVYFVYAVSGGTRSLHVATCDGAFTTRLSSEGQHVLRASISVTASRVAYEATGPAPARGSWAELYTVDLEGGGAKRVSPRVNIQDVTDLALSPDDRYVVFRTDNDPTIVGKRVLYAVSIDGGAPSRLSDPQTVNPGWIYEHLIAPDASRVLYTADETTDNAYECYSVKPDGTGRITLHPPGAWGLDNMILGASAGSQRAVFSNDHGICDGSDLCSSSYLDGSGLVGISAPGARSSYVDRGALSAGKVLRVTKEGSRHEAFLSSDDGTAKVKVSGPLGNADGDVVWALLGPDRTRVAYVADAEVDERFDLYIGAADGSGSAKLTHAMSADGDVVCSRECLVRFAPDATRVAYVTDDAGVVQLHVVGVDGTGRLRLAGSDAGLTSVESLELSPSSRYVAFVAKSGGASALFVADVDGASLTRLTTASGALESFRIAGDSQRIVYAADEGAGYLELFSIRPDGTGKTRLHCDLLGSGVTGYTLVDGWHGVLYTAPQSQAGAVELYGTRIDGTGGVYRLNKPAVAGGIVAELRPTSDANKVVFRGSVEQQGVFEAFLVPVPDGLRQTPP